MNNSVGNTARLMWAGLRALLVLTVICGVIYPLAVTGVAQALFNDKANGSEIKSGGKVVGSELIGQPYNLPKKDPNDAEEAAAPDLKWFQPRPSNGLGTNSVNTQYSLILSGATNRSGDNGAVDGRCPTDPNDAEDGTLCKWVVEAKAAVVKDNSVPGYEVKPSDVLGRRRHLLRLRPGPGHLPGVRQAPDPPRRGEEPPLRRPGRQARRGQHQRPDPRLHGRADGERPQAQHRTQGTHREVIVLRRWAGVRGPGSLLGPSAPSPVHDDMLLVHNRKAAHR